MFPFLLHLVFLSFMWWMFAFICWYLLPKIQTKTWYGELVESDITHFLVIIQCLVFFINMFNAYLNWNVSILCRISIAVTTDEEDEDVDDSEYEPSILVTSILWVLLMNIYYLHVKGYQAVLKQKNNMFYNFWKILEFTLKSIYSYIFKYTHFVSIHL